MILTLLHELLIKINNNKKAASIYLPAFLVFQRSCLTFRTNSVPAAAQSLNYPDAIFGASSRQLLEMVRRMSWANFRQALLCKYMQENQPGDKTLGGCFCNLSRATEPQRGAVQYLQRQISCCSHSLSLFLPFHALRLRITVMILQLSKQHKDADMKTKH